MRLPLRLLFGLLSITTLNAQNDSLSNQAQSAQYWLEVGGLGASAVRTPFWLRANRYGIVPTASPGGLVILGTNGRLGKSMLPQKVQFTYGLEVVGTVSKSSKVLLPEAYLSAQLGKFYVYGGRRKEIIGLGDSTLSSGFYSWSQNALPMTKVQIGTNGFVPLGFTRGLIAINAFYAHGWIPNTDTMHNSFLHQKAVYGRIGKPNWKVRFYGGILHNAQWGGRSAYLPKHVTRDGKLPSSFKDYLYVVAVRQPKEYASINYSEFDAVNRFGNHLGSIDVGAEFSVAKWDVLIYHQHPYEDMSGIAFVNFPDGLYGLRFKRQVRSDSWNGFRVRQVVLEQLTTMDQSGPFSSTGKHYDGRDDYFNNFQYINGWTIQRYSIGTPFLTPRWDLRGALQNAKPDRSYNVDKWAIANNRIQMTYAGLAGEFSSGVQLEARISYSHNYGTFRTPFDSSVSQLSGLLWLTWPLRWLGGSELRTALAVDQGKLYDNSIGGWLSFKKTFSIR